MPIAWDEVRRRQRQSEDFQDRMQELTVEDVMSRELVTVSPDATIHDVASAMLEHHVHAIMGRLHGTRRIQQQRRAGGETLPPADEP